jgi:hypothetical protein
MSKAQSREPGSLEACSFRSPSPTVVADEEVKQSLVSHKNPKTWSKGYRYLHLAIISFGSFLVSWSASVYLSVAPAVAEEFNVNQTECEWKKA